MADESSDHDSRTSLAFRKRNLHESPQYGEHTDITSSDDEEFFDRSRKRLKQDHESADVAEEICDANAHTTSALPAHASVLGRGEVSKATEIPNPSQGLPPATANIQDRIESPAIDETMGNAPLTDLDQSAEGAANEVVLVESSEGQIPKPAMVESGTDVTASTPLSDQKPNKPPLDIEEAGVSIAQTPYSIQDTAQAGRQTAPPTGWNQGIRTGLRTAFSSKLRTSFGDKKKPLDTPHIPPQELPQPRDAPLIGIVEAPIATSSAPMALPSGISSMVARHQSAFKKMVKPNPEKQAANTLEVDRALALEKTWPLPRTCDRLDTLVAGGQTYYPTCFGQRPKPFYLGNRSTKIPLDLPIILTSQGFPYKIQDFSFNIFAPPFLKLNIDKLPVWTNGQLRSAFNHYNVEFYSHLSHLRGALQGTAKASGFLSFEEALEAAKRLPSVVSIGALGRNSTTGDSPSIDMLPTVTYATNTDPQPSANLAKQDVPQSPGHSANNFQQTIIIIDDSNDDSHPVDTTEDDVKSAEDDDEAEEEVGAVLSSHMETNPDIDVAEIELHYVQTALQRKYFPGESDSIRRCLACGDLGHWQTDCSVLNCTICGENGKHSNFTCPANQRCEKCLERGHPSTKCSEKLQSTRAEAGNCDICEAKDHLERSCHYIWRSFAPKPEEIRKVRNIPVHCYTCGATGHYGPQCGLHSGPLLAGEYTWSQGNVRKYVDPESQYRAVSAGIDYSLPKKRQDQADFSIKGKGRLRGRGNDPLTIEDSDGDNDFIRPKINTPPQRGNIHFGGNQQQQSNGGSYHSHIPTSQNYLEDNIQYYVASNRDDSKTNSYGNAAQPSYSTFGKEVLPSPPPPPPPSHKAQPLGRAPRANKYQRQGQDARPRRPKPALNEDPPSRIGESSSEKVPTSSTRRTRKASRRAAAAA